MLSRALPPHHLGHHRRVSGASRALLPHRFPHRLARASPRVTAISPTSGTKAGGTSVTITGSGFSNATAVDFGGVSAVMTVDSGTEITATSPPGTGTVQVTVITLGWHLRDRPYRPVQLRQLSGQLDPGSVPSSPVRGITGQIVANTSLLIAVLVYMGWAFDDALYGYFHIRPLDLNFSIVEYMLRSLALFQRYYRRRCCGAHRRFRHSYLGFG